MLVGTNRTFVFVLIINAFLCVHRVVIKLCGQRPASLRHRGRCKQHNRQLTSALTQLAHPGKVPEVRLKATPGRAAEPVLLLSRCSRPGDVALSPACVRSCGRPRMSSPEQARLERLTVTWLDPLCAPLAGLAPLGVGAPESTSVGGAPGLECGCSGRGRAGAVVRGVTSYLRRKGSYCWPCLVHDGARMMVLLISHSATLCSCLLLLRRPF